MRTLIVNHNVAKSGFLSNIWGDQHKLVEGARIGLVVRRKITPEGFPGAPEIVPWAELDYDIPPMCSRAHGDEMNRNQHGYYIPIGRCMELSGKDISERKRRDAIGNNGKSPAVAHDAYGTLPRIKVEWRV